MFKVLMLLLFARFFGIPIIPVIILIVVFYLLDRRFIGLLPNVMKPFRRMSRIRKLRAIVEQSPYDASSKLELARLLMERRKYGEALQLLEPLKDNYEESAEYWDDLAVCYLRTGKEQQAKDGMLKALDLNDRVKYGAPYLRLAELHRQSNTEQALVYLQLFQDIQSSSCEAYNSLSKIYTELGKREEAKRAAQEGLRVYRMLPRYKKKLERKWALRLYFKK